MELKWIYCNLKSIAWRKFHRSRDITGLDPSFETNDATTVAYDDQTTYLTIRNVDNFSVTFYDALKNLSATNEVPVTQLSFQH
jgi:hypothetical protein